MRNMSHRQPHEAQALSDRIWQCRRLIEAHKDAIVFYSVKRMERDIEGSRAALRTNEELLERLLEQQG